MGAWADAIEEAVRPVAPTLLDRPDVVVLLEELRALTVPCSRHPDPRRLPYRPGGPDRAGLVRHRLLARRAARHGGRASWRRWRRSGDGPVYRSPLADVADLLWSLGAVADDAAAERDPTGREGLGELAAAWEQRNRRAFFAGYLGVAGISGLVPPGREAVRVLVTAFELERVAARLARQSRRARR